MKVVIATCKNWRLSMAKEVEVALNCHVDLVTHKSDLTMEKLQVLQPAYIFFPHWSYLIPEAIFENFNCIIFHMTDLPFGRGGSPLQNLIARGIYETQITALKCVKELDAGPIYLKRPLSLHGNAQEIYYRANQIIQEMIIEIMTQKPVPTAQIGEPVVFKRRTPEQSDVQQLQDLNTFYDYIRMLDAEGYPKAFLEVGAFRLELSRASFIGEKIIADVEIRKKDE